MQKRKRHFAIAGKTASADQWAALMMIGALGIALLCVNSPLKLSYDIFHHTPVVISFGDFTGLLPIPLKPASVLLKWRQRYRLKTPPGTA